MLCRLLWSMLTSLFIAKDGINVRISLRDYYSHLSSICRNDVGTKTLFRTGNFNKTCLKGLNSSV